MKKLDAFFQTWTGRIVGILFEALIVLLVMIAAKKQAISMIETKEQFQLLQEIVTTSEGKTISSAVLIIVLGFVLFPAFYFGKWFMEVWNFSEIRKLRKFEEERKAG